MSANPLGMASLVPLQVRVPAPRAIMAQGMGIKGWCPNPKDCEVATQPMWSLGNVPDLSGNAYFGKGCLDYDTPNNAERFQIIGSCPENLLA